MKLLVLYEELAGYFLACISKFAKDHPGEVLILRKKVNAVAPFEFHEQPGIRFVDRDDLSKDELMKMADDFNPDGILCAGWAFKPYLAVCRKFQSSIPVILGFDNWWTGSFKQRITTLLARRYFKKRFNRCFVPGKRQRTFALRLGFPEKYIAEGAYSCDFEKFHAAYKHNREQKKSSFPRRFIFVGRYEPEKGITQLLEAFDKASSSSGEKWELWCLGKGSIKPEAHPAVRHLGFVQPQEMESLVAQCGVFVLPSLFEPWGVAVHEFAAAGFPLLLSRNVGASEIFLEEGVNGFSFPAGDIFAMENAFLAVMKLSSEQLNEMGRRSAEKAAAITPGKWAATLFGLIHFR